MQLNTLKGWIRDLSPAERWAIVAWSVLGIVTIGQAAFVPRNHTVYPIFANAGENWNQGQMLYRDYRGPKGVDFFRYSPTAAAFFAMFTVLPLRVGGIVWRSANAGFLVVGLLWWCRAILPAGLSGRRRGLFFLLALPLSAASLHNGQSNPMALGLLLMTAAAAAEGSWTLAALAVVFAAIFKVYPLAIGMLIAVAFPRQFAWKLIATVLLAALIPFFTQSPEYVAERYAEWFHYLVKDTRHNVSLDATYRDLRFIAKVWGWRFNHLSYLTLQLGGAACAAVACLAVSRRRWPVQKQLGLALALGTIWMTLLGPATEVCTYIFIAPTLAWATIEPWVERRSRLTKLLTLGSCTLFLFDIIYPGGAGRPHLALQPIAAILLLAGIVQLAIATEPIKSPSGSNPDIDPDESSRDHQAGFGAVAPGIGSMKGLHAHFRVSERTNGVESPPHGRRIES